MSIHIILGKPGSGKSRHSTEVAGKQLLDTNRNVVTNLPIDMGRLNEFLQERFPREPVDVVRRLRIMTDDEMRNFWKFRGPDLRSTDEIAGKVDEEKRFGRDDGRGVCYLLDEAHIAFNARDWAVLGRDAIHYMFQHRKLGDVVFPITQAVGNLDKQFRSVAEDYTVCRNEAVMKLGPFRGAPRFKLRRYYSEPTNNAEPYETVTFDLDKKGWASCYDTAKGIGVHGSKADIGRRAKGISIYWVFPIVICTAMLCVFIPMMLGRMAGSYVSGGKNKPGAGAKGAPDKPDAIAPAAAIAAFSGRDPAGAADLRQPTARTNTHTPPLQEQVWVMGSIVRRGKYNLLLSDGRTLSEDDGILQGGGRNFVETKDGQRFWWRNKIGPFPTPPPLTRSPGS